MNYRLLQKKGERHHNQVTSFVDQNKYDDLLVYDELRHIRSQKSFREVKKVQKLNQLNLMKLVLETLMLKLHLINLLLKHLNYYLMNNSQQKILRKVGI